MSSKLVEVVPLSAEKLIMYTDNSISLEELLGWEQLLLPTLGWQLTPPTPHSFLEYIFNVSIQNVPTDLCSFGLKVIRTAHH